MRTPDNLDPGERWTWEETYRQIWRLKRGWGYGRWTTEEADEMASGAATRAVEITRSHSPGGGSGTIPRVLHRVAIGDEPSYARDFWRRFAELHPGWDLLTHDPQRWPDEYPRTSRMLRQARNLAQVADVARLEVLAEHGGIYVDWDVEPVSPLDGLVELESVTCFAAWEDARVVPNTVIGATPRHPAVLALLDLQAERIPGPTWWAGPGVTTAILPGRLDAVLLPPESFYPVHYKDPERDAKLAGFRAEDSPLTWAVHHYAGSWLKERG